MTNTPKRQPKGTTTGGQFAPSQNPESNVSLQDEMECDPYSQYPSARSLLSKLSDVPDSEPVLHSFFLRSDATSAVDREVTTDEWDQICQAFSDLAGEDYGPYWALHEVISEAADEASSADKHDLAEPYLGRGLTPARHVRERLTSIPADEPVIAWLRTRQDVCSDTDSDLSPNQWADVCERFGLQAAEKHGAYESMWEAFMEAAESVAGPVDDDDEFESEEA